MWQMSKIEHWIGWSNGRKCVEPVDNNSFIIFRYETDPYTRNEIIYVQREKPKIMLIKNDKVFDG